MKVYFLSVIILLSIGVIIEAEAYGNYQPTSEYEALLVESDKESYVIGEVINITGTVEKYHENESIQIILYSPIGKVILLSKADVDAEKNFQYSLILLISNKQVSITLNLIMGDIQK